MTDVPIIFSAPMVRALLEGRKTMTRRLGWSKSSIKRATLGLTRSAWCNVKPGDRLWVRENIIRREAYIDYASDGISGKITPSIHMPRTASRLTLIVERVKIERLHAITIEDVLAEGVPATAPIGAFAELWDRLHGAGAWFANPEVVALSFRVLPANIDTFPKAPISVVNMGAAA